METVKSVASEGVFLLDPGKLWTRIDIIIGENFRTLKGGRFMLNETPLIDASLVPFSNLHIDNKSMSFQAKVQKIDTKFEVDLSKNKAASLIANFVKRYNEDQWQISTGHFNSVLIKIEKKYLTIRVEYVREDDVNIDNKNWLIISFNEYCNYVQIKEPSISQKRFESIKAVTLDHFKLRVECSGRNVWAAEEEDDEDGYNYEWDLDIQPEFQELIIGLLDIGIQSQRKKFKA
ncbi:MAG: hypothetical protein J0G98_05405 [Terrimonas ferruginea]|uniref:hypothetical protein n=1 Tax=Terrimonas ferruginea TaxID=249 RepID=UPI0009264A5B|nr:hypothetical protein [Terrimonas ferruginea]MBN8782482.1 hypothetical protein [Terrimonas ferruginea]OJW42991.1 MAG: hypothetical protein BGO56_13265 [Sphingobacteriales bacterium 48-107]